MTKKELMEEIALGLRTLNTLVATLPADESTVERFSAEVDGETITWPARPLRADIAESLRHLSDELRCWYK